MKERLTAEQTEQALVEWATQRYGELFAVTDVAIHRRKVTEKGESPARYDIEAEFEMEVKKKSNSKRKVTLNDLPGNERPEVYKSTMDDFVAIDDPEL